MFWLRRAIAASTVRNFTARFAAQRFPEKFISEAADCSHGFQPTQIGVTHLNVTREPERERTAFLAVRSRSGSRENKRPLGNCVSPIKIVFWRRGRNRPEIVASFMFTLFSRSLLLPTLCATMLSACAQNAATVAATVAGGAPHIAAPGAVQQTPVPVTIRKTADGYELLRDGKPYLIKGAGGSGSWAALRARGANSVRTWGAENLAAQLDQAHKLGLTVTAGIWLGHTQHGFSYDDPKQVEAQFEQAKKVIDQYKDHPALLMWGIGNEMEGFGAQTNPNVWKAVQQIAAYAHRVAPNHPTMTVTADIGADKVPSLNKYCPRHRRSGHQLLWRRDFDSQSLP